MKARDVMSSPVVTVKPTASVKDVAQLFLERRISGVPVVDDQRKLVGIVSEGDLVHRSEISTVQRRPWWLVLMAGDEGLAADYITTHAKKVADIMTRKVITSAPDAPLHEIAETLEKYGIKRVPIVRDEQLVGIVSRANLVQAIATSGSKLDVPLSDTTIREKLLTHLNRQSWAHATLLNATVSGGVIDLWGFVGSDTERKSYSCRRRINAGGARCKRSYDRAAVWLLMRMVNTNVKAGECVLALVQPSPSALSPRPELKHLNCCP